MVSCAKVADYSLRERSNGKARKPVIRLRTWTEERDPRPCEGHAQTHLTSTFAPMQLQNYACGEWVAGAGKQSELIDAVNGELIGTTSSTGLDFGRMLTYGREVGGPTLRKMTFPERGRMLKALAMYLMDRKESYYELSYRTGATKADSWVDIEGGIGNLFANASLRRLLDAGHCQGYAATG